MITPQTGLRFLDGALADGRPFLCGERFTIVDIRFYVYYRFISKIDKRQAVPAELQHVHALLERVGARESAQAILPPKREKKK